MGCYFDGADPVDSARHILDSNPGPRYFFAGLRRSSCVADDWSEFMLTWSRLLLGSPDAQGSSRLPRLVLAEFVKLAINESFRIIQLLRCYHRIIVVRWRGNRPRRYSVGNSETRHAKAWRRAARIDAPTVGISPAPASQPEYSPHPEIPMRKSQDRTREGALPSLTLRPRTRRTLSILFQSVPQRGAIRRAWIGKIFDSLEPLAPGCRALHPTKRNLAPSGAELEKLLEIVRPMTISIS